MACVNPDLDDGAGLIRQRIAESILSKQRMLASDCVARAAELASLMADALLAGGKVVFFGNGGSASDAGHLAAELLGKYSYDRPPMAAMSLPDHVAATTAIGNDFDYGEIFARQVRGVCSEGDVAVGITTSGNSENVIRALVAARELGMVTTALTGEDGGKLPGLVDVCVQVPERDRARIQEACLHLGHSVCEIVERRLYPPG